MPYRFWQPFRCGSARCRRSLVALLLALACGCPAAAPAAEAPERDLRQSAVVRAVRRVSPLVVNISSEYEIRTRANPFAMRGMDRFFDNFFNDFFDPGFEHRAKRTSLGSGLIIDPTHGYILTNAHVIVKTGKIKVVLQDEREFEAHIVGADPDSDLAVLKIDAADSLPDIDLAYCEDPMIGETVIAIGNPFGFSHTVTTGVISAVNRSFRTDEKVYRDFIQTDASINPGNSGGPLLNINGDLIGINTAIYANAQGIGFAIPVAKVTRIADDLIRHGEVIPAWLGLTVQEIDEGMSRYLGMPNARGVMVKALTTGGPAAAAGIREGDIVRSLGKGHVSDPSDFESLLKQYTAGDSIPVSLWRDGRERTVAVKAAAFPQEQAMAQGEQMLGVRVADLTRENRRRFGVTAGKGVIIEQIDRGSQLARIGAGPGDVIRQIDEMVIDSLADYKKAIVKYRRKNSLVLLLQRADQLYYITVGTR